MKSVNFEIVSPLVKFDSDPARWKVRLKMKEDGRQLEALVDTASLLKFPMFAEEVFDQAEELLIDMPQSRWKGMLRDVKIETKTPKRR